MVLLRYILLPNYVFHFIERCVIGRYAYTHITERNRHIHTDTHAKRHTVTLTQNLTSTCRGDSHIEIQYSQTQRESDTHTITAVGPLSEAHTYVCGYKGRGWGKSL